MAEGIKFDGDKVRLELLPPELLHAVGTILTFGAKKYADRNWELGMDWSRVYGALLRHLNAWMDPNEPDTDPETGKSHLWHAGCCIAFLITYEIRQVGKDDRPNGDTNSEKEKVQIEEGCCGLGQEGKGSQIVSWNFNQMGDQRYV